ncbi:hypothetical protein BH23PAT1_BH23PAT1_1140 [soil metagenome]
MYKIGIELCVKVVYKWLVGLVQLPAFINKFVGQIPACVKGTSFLLRQFVLSTPVFTQAYYYFYSVKNYLYPFYTRPIITTTNLTNKIITIGCVQKLLFYLHPVHNLMILMKNLFWYSITNPYMKQKRSLI